MTLQCDICFVARFGTNEFCLEMNEYQGHSERYKKSNTHLKNMVTSNSNILFITYTKPFPTVGSQKSSVIITDFPPKLFTECGSTTKFMFDNK